MKRSKIKKGLSLVMKLGEAEKRIKEELEKIYDESESRNIASLIIEHCTSLDRMALIVNREVEFSPLQVEQLHSSLHRLLQHEPIQYIMNKAWFYGLELYVDRNVLIPRPETEELVHWILEDIKAAGENVFHKNVTDADVTKQLKILDIGAGSGCIALALKNNIPKAEVWGCDVSEEALNVARRNGANLNIRVDFQGVNILDEAQQKLLPTVDILVSNPPYIPASDKESMAQNVLAWEPHTALFVPNNNALLFYKTIAQFSKKRLYQGGTIYLEIHEALSGEVVKLFKGEGYTDVDVKKDMQGKERMVRVRKTS